MGVCCSCDWLTTHKAGSWSLCREGEISQPRYFLRMIIYIIRGLPGAGKSTLAKKLVNEQYVCEADQHFVDADGIYRFDPKRLSEAHTKCQQRCADIMEQGLPVAVANTFTQKWEMKVYLDMAKRYNYSVQEIICKSSWKSIHGVPDEAIRKMEQRFEF